MRMKLAASAVLCAVALSGCVQLGRTSRVNPVIVAKRQAPDKCPYVAGVGSEFKYALNLDCFTFQSTALDTAITPDPQNAVETKYTAYSLALTDVKYRNRLEAILLSHSDANCEKEKGHIFANEAVTGLALDFAASAFSGAATIVGGEQAKSILSGLAGLSTATRSHVSADVYKNQIVPAITNVIDAERRRILTEIIAKRSLSKESYSPDDMIRMVNSYHQACSFQLGVQLLLKASENKAGSEAIIQTMNLQFALQKLNEAPQSTERDEKIKELTLQLATIAQSAQGQANTATKSAQ